VAFKAMDPSVRWGDEGVGDGAAETRNA